MIAKTNINNNILSRRVIFADLSNERSKKWENCSKLSTQEASTFARKGPYSQS